MTASKNRNMLENVQRQVGRIAAGGGAFQDITKPTDFGAVTPAPANSRLKDEGRTKTAEEKPAFARWLLLQVDQGGFLGQLAQVATSDRGYPKDSDAEAVRKRLNTLGADTDMHEALDDAELEWSSF
jgi:hypothetical protein